MNIFLLILYIGLSTGGATAIKFGGSEKFSTLFTIPKFAVDVSFVTLSGIIAYGLSFLVFVVLLNKLDLSYLTPVATGASYVILMFISVLVFNEHFNTLKLIGCTLILIGVVFVIMNSSKIA